MRGKLTGIFRRKFKLGSFPALAGKYFVCDVYRGGVIWLLLHKGGFPGGSEFKDSDCNARDAGDTGSIPGSEGSPGGGRGSPLL